jgi:hypothetical protein
MTGPSTVLAILEMYRIAEEILPKVRQELYRLGCLDSIKVSIEDGYFRFHYKEQNILVNPNCVLAILQAEHSSTSTDIIWEQVLQQASRQYSKTRFSLMVIAGCIVLLMFAIFFVIK